MAEEKEDELSKILGEKEKVTPPASSLQGEKTEEEKARVKAVEELRNLEAAKTEALAELQKLRQEIKGEKGDDSLPKIDFEDPSAKAWDKHVEEKLHPMREVVEQEKQEVFQIAVERFLADNPALSSDKEKMRQVVETYDRLSKGRISERNVDVVHNHLIKAYRAEFGDSILEARSQERAKQSERETEFSKPAVSRSTGSYRSEKQTEAPLTGESREIAQAMDKAIAALPRYEEKAAV